MVRDASGKPAPSVLVSFFCWPNLRFRQPDEMKTNQNGRYVVLTPGKVGNGREVLNAPFVSTDLVVARDVERNLAAIGGFPWFLDMPRNLDLTLEPGVCVSGSVRDKDGTPVTSATLKLSFTAHGSMESAVFGRNVVFWEPLSLPPAEADGRGLFNFTALPPGPSDYLVTASAKGYGVGTAYIGYSGTNTNRYELVPIVLKRADRRLAGRVVNPDGTPASEVSVSFFGEGQPRAGEVKSDKEGKFVFESVCEGPITMNAHQETLGGGTYCEGGGTNVVVKLFRDATPVVRGALP
jgi:hypothetical protein